jgi:hypothetical protein
MPSLIFRTRHRYLSHRVARFLALCTGVLSIGAMVSCGGGKGGVGVPETLTLSLAGNGQGTVISSPGQLNCGNVPGAPASTCQADFDQGDQVTLAATPAAGSTFDSWGGDGISCLASAPCSFTMSGSRTVVATFVTSSASQTLTVSGSGSGSGVLISDPAGLNCTITGGVAAATGCSASFPSGTSVELQIQSGTVVGFGGACSGTGCTVTMSQARSVLVTFTPDAPATQLAFVVQPSAVQLNQPIAPPVQVAIEDAQGQPLPGRTDAVTLAIGANPASAALGGTVTQTAVNGIATFGDLTLNQIGDGYSLTASVTGLPTATSSTFNVTTEPAALLAFSVPPTTTAAGASIAPAIKVEIRDRATNAVLTSRTDPISVTLQANPGGSTLAGNLQVNAVGGIATFSNLTLQKAATGYKLAVATPNASGAVSDAFDIIAGPPVQFLLNSSATQSAPVGTAVPERPSVAVRDAFNNPVANVPVTWVVTAGGGTVIASTTDPVNRPTGPLGLSTAVSWTLGPDVGTPLNNSLEARTNVAGIVGSPITFKATGTIPAGQGVFTGTLKETSAVGVFGPAIPSATLKFQDLTNLQTPAVTVTSKTDGSFVSPPLPAGRPFRIDVTAPPTYKSIAYQKPLLTSGATFALGNLGMVVDNPEGGQSSLTVTVQLDPAPTSPIPVRIEAYRGYYISASEPDSALAINDAGQSGEALEVDPTDWGVMTLLVTAESYEPLYVPVVINEPNGSDVFEVTLHQ